MQLVFRTLGARARRALLASSFTFLLVPSLVVATVGTAASAPRTYHTKGVVKSFGAGRAYVNIAHEDIPGYMSAMTMSFEPRSKTQLDGIAEKDKVEFDFSDSDDGRRVLVAIRRSE